MYRHIKMLAGDFSKEGRSVYNEGMFSDPRLELVTDDLDDPQKIPLTELDTVEEATEENVNNIGGAVGWGTAGALLLGPVGLLAGALLGGKKQEVTFVAKLKDGRKFMATTDKKTFIKLKAAVFS